MIKLTLFYREGCHLCVEMLNELHSYLQRPDIELQRIDIDENPEWLATYNELVPVLHVNDEPICKYYLNRARLEQYLADVEMPS